MVSPFSLLYLVVSCYRVKSNVLTCLYGVLCGVFRTPHVLTSSLRTAHQIVQGDPEEVSQGHGSSQGGQLSPGLISADLLGAETAQL